VEQGVRGVPHDLQHTVRQALAREGTNVDVADFDGFVKAVQQPALDAIGHPLQRECARGANERKGTSMSLEALAVPFTRVFRETWEASGQHQLGPDLLQQLHQACGLQQFFEVLRRGENRIQIFFVPRVKSLVEREKQDVGKFLIDVGSWFEEGNPTRKCLITSLPSSLVCFC
jgi:hypothetical protein